jgi:hypothetical protein
MDSLVDFSPVDTSKLPQIQLCVSFRRPRSTLTIV